MTIEKLRKKLQEKIDDLKDKYGTIPENEFLERANILGKINGLLTALNMSYDE